MNFNEDISEEDEEKYFEDGMPYSLFRELRREEFETGLLYYRQILELNAENYITLNNIGSVLMQNGGKDEALRYFNRALDINPEYPNTHLALGIFYEGEGKYLKSFDCAIKTLG